MAETTSPWLTAREAAAYIKHGRRFVRNEISKGKIRAVLVGGRREPLTRVEWLDEYLVAQATPVPMPRRIPR